LRGGGRGEEDEGGSAGEHRPDHRSAVAARNASARGRSDDGADGAVCAAFAVSGGAPPLR
ncbi:MAG TPA: hypothetical protein VK081_14145, partial [Planctomycetota bacterium]|nr:hypothetical protein [Planctomycetota bacterium]